MREASDNATGQIHELRKGMTMNRQFMDVFMSQAVRDQNKIGSEKQNMANSSEQMRRETR